MDFKFLTLEQKDGVATITLNRPDAFNALSLGLGRDLFHAALEVDENPAVRCVVVTGAGRAFSSGIDLNALAAGELKLDWFRHFDEALRRLEQLDALTVARIRGYALGGGLQIALACDLRISTPESRFGLPAVLEALIPGMGTYRLPRFIGLGRARRLVMTGELIGAEEAERIGLIDWIVPEEKLDQMVQTMITDVMSGSAAARLYAKRLVTASFESTFDAAFAKYLEYQAECLLSPDHKLAMAQFRKKK